ncbi:hypothetical protein OG897_13360 [Streptomyces sp. NBC_00237]|uniref:zinc finger domain-containing protein n=1 Tax=Streptomyces sp. NBC_00237 TaxID=2975687 RepID=UPI002255E96D|nr:hypothetical protein [Streptomyces sp. NBC_00237]MCX5202431.1 hypothetical protein [Streptomyces sp. NBC_00237]
MTLRNAAPMPENLRHFMRAKAHPARSVACPHCGAHEHKPCTTISGRRILTEPHPGRRYAWARLTACCPRCQVTPTVPCHLDGMPLAGEAVHAERYTEAERTAA